LLDVCFALLAAATSSALPLLLLLLLMDAMPYACMTSAAAATICSMSASLCLQLLGLLRNLFTMSRAPGGRPAAAAQSEATKQVGV
jgi:hypothetical protein